MRSDAADVVVRELLFAMHIYPNYPVDSRGVSGCLLRAMEAVRPDLAERLEAGEEASDLYDELESGEEQPNAK